MQNTTHITIVGAKKKNPKPLDVTICDLLAERSACVCRSGRSLQTQCGVNSFILDSRRVLAPAPKVPGSDIKTHLKSRCRAILKKRDAM